MLFITALLKAILAHIIEKECSLNRKIRFENLTNSNTVLSLKAEPSNPTKINESKISSASDLFYLPFFYSIEFSNLIIKFRGEHSCIIEPDENQSQNYFIYSINHQTIQEILFE